MLIDYKQVKIYQQEKLILDQVDFHVEEGEFVYIIGKVGSGKSSLLKTLYCELDIYQDEAEKAEVLGRNLTSIRRKDIPALRKEMGIIFQDFKLLTDRTIYKNLQFVLKATGWKKKDEINQRIEEVLTDVGLLDKKDNLPHELSGGEQQRIAIARALLNHPKVIIADEPTGNLDPDTAEKIVGLLYEISHTGTPVVISTHNHGWSERFPGHVYKCENGKLIEMTDKTNKENNK